MPRKTKSRLNNELILAKLAALYPQAKTELNYRNTFELLVAVILSAQCTDKRVNMVTAKLFAKYDGPQAFAALTPETLAEDIKSCGLFRTKSKNIVALARQLVEEYDGQVPCSYTDLINLPGVGRKTANVVLSNAFDQPAIAVDTHVFRVANRLGLATARTPLETEKQLMKAIPRAQWSAAHHWLILHGRRICKAIKPRCADCPLAPHCRFAQTSAKETGQE